MKAHRGPRSGFAAHAVALGCLTLAAAGGVLAQPLGALFVDTAGAATPTVPYTDPNAVGSIGLCNQAGQQITSGSISTTPFAWRAVSTQPAQAPYDNAGRTADLVVYQPQQDLPAGDWSGTQLTASSSYTNPANPMAAATDGDQSLQGIIEAYPPRWDGFLQLRMYLSTAGHEPYEATYPTLNIQVTGDTWQAVGGSPVNCASGTAVSIESVLLRPSTTTSTSSAAAPASAPPAAPTTAASGQGKDAAVGATAASDATSSPGRGTPAGSVQASGSGRAVATTQTSGFPVVLGIVLAVLVLLGAMFSLVLRRRRLATTPLPSASPPVSPSARSSSTTRSSSTKGDTP